MKPIKEGLPYLEAALTLSHTQKPSLYKFYKKNHENSNTYIKWNMDSVQTKKPIILYYYTTKKNFYDNILPEKKLYFSPIRYTNDHLEGVGVAFGSMRANKEDILPDPFNMNAKYLCLTKNHPMSFFAPPMWRRYAEKQEGICIEIQFNCELYNKMYKINNKISHGKIQYLPIVDLFGGQATGSFSINKDVNAFQSKDITWLYEREYRFVYEGNEDDDQYVALDHSIIDYSISIFFCFNNKNQLMLYSSNQNFTDLSVPVITTIDAQGRIATFSDDRDFVDPPTSDAVYPSANQ